MNDLIEPTADAPPSGRWVVLGEELGRDGEELGGKAASLGAMIRAGLPVPPGFCLTTGAFREWLRGCAAAERCIRRFSEGGDVGADELRRTSAALREALQAAPLPESLVRGLRETRELVRPGVRWAVRSSATAEDLPGASFAGQHDTVLDVLGVDAMLEAVRRCWLSLFSARAVQYRRRQRLPDGAAAMAVVVQEMVRAEFSGVLFTVDPLTGRSDRWVTEYVAGSGESVVRGTARPGRAAVEKESGRAIEWDEGDPGVRLAPATLDRLRLLGAQAEQLFGGPQDIEWVQQGGQVWLLQSRPITSLGRVEVGAGGSVWSNMNVAENLPNVATPMTWSMLNTAFHHIGDELFRGFGIDPVRQPPVGLIAGRVYLNATSVREILSALPGFRGLPSAWLLGGYQDGAAGTSLDAAGARERTAGNPRRARVRLWPLLKLLARRGSWRGRRRYLAGLNRIVDQFAEVDARRLSDAELVAHFRQIWGFGLAKLRFPLMLGPGLVLGPVLCGFTAKWLDDPRGQLAGRLLSGAGGMASAQAALDLWQLAVWVSSKAAVKAAVLGAVGFGDLAVALAGMPDERDFLERWETFLRRHGHRTRGEVDIAIARWSERPDEVLGRLRHYVRNVGRVDPLRVLEGRRLERDRVLAECRAQLRPPFRRWRFEVLVRQAQAGLVFRENLKSELVRSLVSLRQLLLELGRRLSLSGTLGQPEDIFFLTLEEIEPVLEIKRRTDWRAIVAERRAEHAAKEAMSPPPVVVGAMDLSGHRRAVEADGEKTLPGLAVSSGVGVGPARVILQADTTEEVQPGEILVAPHTDPGWAPHFLTASGLVTDLGGQLSHGSVVAREYGLPAVVNVRGATDRIRTGQRIRVDGDRGIVTILD